MDKLKSFLIRNKIEICENFDMSQISTIKLGAVISLAIFPHNKKELIKIVGYLQSSKIYFKLIGNASNVLFVSGVNYPVIITNKMSDEIVIKGKLVEVSSGMLISKFCDTLRKNNLSGAEGLANIPATIGGAIINNAGAFGYSISDHLVKIEVMYEGKIFDILKKEIHFAHHYSNLSGFACLSATFLFENKNEYDIIKSVNEFTYLRGMSQPNGLSLGSVYKKTNDKSAGFFIERCGLKGVRVGGVSVSNKHANFFINDKSGSVSDFLRLLAIVSSAVEKQFGVTLIPEIEKVGDKNEIVGRFTHTFKQ